MIDARTVTLRPFSISHRTKAWRIGLERGS
jgi:hypothetical protein